MSAANFLDSNILVYFLDDSQPRKQSVAARIIADAVRTGSGTISFQVVQEILNVVTRKLVPAFSQADAQRLLANVLLPLWTIMPSRDLYESALNTQGRYGFAFYDSLIIAAALAAGCTRLYSEDLLHGQSIGTLRIENPFI
jgi:predicted nucleic acid-binding protein